MRNIHPKSSVYSIANANRLVNSNNPQPIKIKNGLEFEICDLFEACYL